MRHRAAAPGTRLPAAAEGRAPADLTGARRVARAVPGAPGSPVSATAATATSARIPGVCRRSIRFRWIEALVDGERLSEPARLPGRRLTMAARPVTARLRGSLVSLAAAGLGGASLGFLARDLLELGRPAVAAAWLAGALLGLHSRGDIASERGTATVEWTALTLVVALALGALVAVGPRVDGRPFGGFLAHRIVCAVKGGCRDGDAALARAYGERDAALARALAPNLVYEPGERSLPVDWRRCRARACSDAPDDRDLDTHRSDAGQPATAFVRRVRSGGRTYFLYWLYYPDSNSVLGPSRHGLEPQPAAPARPLPRLPRRRLGGLRGPGRPRRQRLGPSHLARPLAGLQERLLPQPLDGRHRLDACLARQPRRPHPAGDDPRAAAAPRSPDAPPAAARRAGASAGPAALRAPVPRHRPARAHDHRRGPAPDPARDRSAAPGAATGRSTPASARPGASRRGGTRRTSAPRR